MNKLGAGCIGLALAVMLAGCYESPQTTSYEPGVYKGKKDPLMQAAASGREETLQKRFNMVQTDR